MKYANRYGWSDVTPFEVIKTISAKTLEVREMRAERDPTWKPEFVPGGFVGTVVNQDSQRWTITSDETCPTIRIRLGKKGWKDARGNLYAMNDKPHKFYDYNF